MHTEVYTKQNTQKILMALLARHIALVPFAVSSRFPLLHYPIQSPLRRLDRVITL